MSAVSSIRSVSANYIQQLAKIGDEKNPNKFNSPVNLKLETMTKIELAELKWFNLESEPSINRVANSGQTVIFSGVWRTNKPKLTGGPLLNNYEFSQLHFHWGSNDTEGSEHSYNGEKVPLEMHVVFLKENMKQEDALQVKDGTIILSYPYKLGNETNPSMEVICSALSSIQNPNQVIDLDDPVKLSSFVSPFKTDYFVYWGSVRTNACKHILIWILTRQPFVINESQLAKFRKLFTAGHQIIINNSRNNQLENEIFHVNPSAITEDVLYKETKNNKCKKIISSVEKLRKLRLQQRKRYSLPPVTQTSNNTQDNVSVNENIINAKNCDYQSILEQPRTPNLPKSSSNKLSGNNNNVNQNLNMSERTKIQHMNKFHSSKISPQTDSSVIKHPKRSASPNSDVGVKNSLATYEDNRTRPSSPKTPTKLTRNVSYNEAKTESDTLSCVQPNNTSEFTVIKEEEGEEEEAEEEQEEEEEDEEEYDYEEETEEENEQEKIDGENKTVDLKHDITNAKPINVQNSKRDVKTPTSSETISHPRTPTKTNYLTIKQINEKINAIKQSNKKLINRPSSVKNENLNLKEGKLNLTTKESNQSSLPANRSKSNEKKLKEKSISSPNQNQSKINYLHHRPIKSDVYKKEVRNRSSSASSSERKSGKQKVEASTFQSKIPIRISNSQNPKLKPKS